MNELLTDRPLSVLLVGDASNYHQSLATGLRRLGHDVTVASDGSGWMNTSRDIDLSRPLPGKAGGVALWCRLVTTLAGRLRGFDVVSLGGSAFVHLRPSRMRWLYDRLRLNNGSIFYGAIGTDPNYVRECLDPSSVLRYNDFRIYGHPSPYAAANPGQEQAWLSPGLEGLFDHILASSDGSVSCLWEYDVALHRAVSGSRICAGAIPIDTAAVEQVELPDRVDKVRLFLGRHRGRLLEKGTDVLEAAARAVVERYPSRAELVIVENRPYDEYIGLLKSAHVVLDQIYSYTPATNALLAMARGLNTVSGGAPEYYRHIGEEKLRPVIHVEPDYGSVYRAIEETVLHPEMIRPRGLEGRELVVRHNDCVKVAQDIVNFWRERIMAKAYHGEGGAPR